MDVSEALGGAMGPEGTYFPCDGHLTRGGNLVVAEQLAPLVVHRIKIAARARQDEGEL